MKVMERSLIIGIFFTIIYNIVNTNVKCENINSKIFRLHILANSNSEMDQNLKLCVRDKIQEFSKNTLNNVTDKIMAESIFAKNLGNIEKIAKNEIEKYGYNYPVCAKITNKYFNTRNYENFTLPAGNYDALELKIGAGKGKNWWCIMFPTLCIGGPSSKNHKQLENSLNKNEIRFIKSKKNKYVIKFKIVEMYQLFKSWINSNFL